MKALATIFSAPLALAAIITDQDHFTSASLSLSPISAASNNTDGAYCGIGYTYCGYILKEQKKFDDATILTAYCASGFCDSAKGTTQTDPMQALYVCLPQAAIPKAKRDTDGDEPYTGPVKIELLCACSGKPFGGGANVCLNPDADHIGRCSSACSNPASS